MWDGWCRAQSRGRTSRSVPFDDDVATDWADTLSANLVEFLQDGRPIVLAWNQDKAITDRKLGNELATVVALLQKHPNLSTTVAHWDSQRGVCISAEELIQRHGEDAFTHAIANGMPLADWVGRIWDRHTKRRLRKLSQRPIRPDKPGGRLFMPAVPRLIQARIHNRRYSRRHGGDPRNITEHWDKYRDKLTDPADYWKAVAANPFHPVFYGEGPKKAGAALSAGVPMVGMVGARGGFHRINPESSTDKRVELNDDVVQFATPNRPTFIALDQDDAEDTRRDVALAVARFSSLLKERGAKVYIVTWDGEGGKCKGVDDLIVHRGPSAFYEAIAQAQPFDQWYREYQVAGIKQGIKKKLGRYRPHFLANVEDLSWIAEHILETMPQSGIVVLDAPTGTGKTNLAGVLLKPFDGVIAPGNRTSLQRGLGDRLGLDYIDDVESMVGFYVTPKGERTRKLSLCWDSILKIRDREFSEGSYVLFLDEVNEGLRHALIGETCASDGKRPGIQAKLIELIQGASLVLMASAGVSQLDIDLVAELRGNQAPFIIQNQYKAHGYPCELYTDSPEGGDRKFARATVLAKLTAAIADGRRVIVHTDTKANSKMVEQLGLRHGLSPEQILRFDGDTTPEKLQRDFADRPNEFLAEPDIKLLIASPSLTSGVSMTEDHFDLVVGLFEGQSIEPSAAMQQLHRFRLPVPRVVFAAAKGRTNGMGAINALDYTSNQHQRARLIDRSLPDVDLEGTLDEGTPTARYVAAARAQESQEMARFGLYLRAYLEMGHHQVTHLAPLTDKDPEWGDRIAAALEQLPELRDAVKDQEMQDRANAAEITAEKAEELRNQKNTTYKQRLDLNRFDVCAFYEIEQAQFGLSILEYDNDGRTRKGLRFLADQLMERVASDRDEKIIGRLQYWKKPIAHHDLPQYELKRKAVAHFGILDALAKAVRASDSGKGWDSDTDWIQSVYEQVIAHAQEIKLALNYTPSRKESPAQVFGKLIRQLTQGALRTEARQVGGRENRHRVRQFSKESLKRAREFLTQLVKRLMKEKSIRPYTHDLTKLLLIDVVCTDGVPPIEPTAPAQKLTAHHAGKLRAV